MPIDVKGTAAPGKMMFRGNQKARVDEKGRLKLPIEFKRPLTENYGSLFYITSKDGKVAEIYPLKEWEKFEEKLAAIPSFHPAKKKLMDLLNYYGQTVEIDPQGRLLMPQILREEADLMTDEVVVIGIENHLEVANEAWFRQNRVAPLTLEDQQALAGFGV